MAGSFIGHAEASVWEPGCRGHYAQTKITTCLMDKEAYFASRSTMDQLLQNVFTVGLTGPLDTPDPIPSISSRLCNAGITPLLPLGH